MANSHKALNVTLLKGFAWKAVAIYTGAALLILAPSLGQAQSSSRTQIRYKDYRIEVQDVPANRLMLDGGLLINSGIGAAYERSLGSRFSVGPFVGTYKLTNSSAESSTSSSKSDIKFDAKSDVQTFGVRGRFFFSDVARHSAYILTGVSHTRVRTEAEIENSGSDTVTDTQTGILAGGGYQWVLSSVPLMFNVGGGFGSGNGVKVSASRVGNESTKIEEHEIIGGIFFEANFGFLF